MTALLQHPELEPWWRPELEALPWPPAPEQAASAYDAAAAPKLSALISEVMRLNPPVGGFFRRTTRELVLDGVAVPAGQVVQVALAASNRYREAGSGSAVEKPPRSEQAAATTEDTPASANPGATTSDTSSQPPDDLATFRPQRHLAGDTGLTLLPFGGGERVCLGKALAELEIRLMAVGLLGRLQLQLVPKDQDLSLQLIPSPSPRGGLRVVGLGVSAP